MKLHKDLTEFIGLLNSHKVDYVIVGGHAVAFHGYPRFTGDTDFLIRPTAENAQRLMRVLQAFGFGDTLRSCKYSALASARDRKNGCKTSKEKSPG